MDMTKEAKISLQSPSRELVLVPAEAKDDVDAAALRSDAETLQYLPFKPKSMSVEEWRAKREMHAQKKDEIWNIHAHPASLSSTSPASSTFVGQCGISQIDFHNRVADVGIMVASRSQRTGIATEALYLLLQRAFENPSLKLHRVQFVTGSNNIQMKGWLESFGVKQEYRQREAWSDGHGGWLDTVVYSILEGEWPALREKMGEKISSRSRVA